MKSLKLFLLAISLLFTVVAKSQTDDAKTVDNYIELVNYWGTVGPTKEAKFSKYIEYKHSFTQNFSEWKKENKFLYIKEMWYYSESFYIRKGISAEGNSMDESMIDISRFENYRKENEESTIILPGFKDAIVLLPNSKLIYKP